MADTDSCCDSSGSQISFDDCGEVIGVYVRASDEVYPLSAVEFAQRTPDCLPRNSSSILLVIGQLGPLRRRSHLVYLKRRERRNHSMIAAQILEHRVKLVYGPHW